MKSSSFYTIYRRLKNWLNDSIAMQQTERKWEKRHYQIAKESDEKFKTHSKEQEIDI